MRYHNTGQDNWTPRPKSGFTREYIYGPLAKDSESPIRGIIIGIALTIPVWAAALWIML